MFDTVEIDSTFYRLPDRARFATWANSTPDGFVFAVKASRFITHIRRLREPSEPVDRLVDAATGLGPKLGPILLQLPPTLRADCRALDGVLTAFRGRARVAVEFRHASWSNAEVEGVLSAHGAARVLADRVGKITGGSTVGWEYVRLHEGRAEPRPCYGAHALRSWADRLRGASGYVYFNNDAHACAVRNAETLRALLSRRRTRGC